MDHARAKFLSIGRRLLVERVVIDGHAVVQNQGLWSM